MTQPEPYPETREIPRIRPQAARPTGHLPTTEAPFIRPVPKANPQARPARPATQQIPVDPVRLPEPPTGRHASLDELFTAQEDEAEYPSPRSKNPLHVYGPQILVGGALALAIVLVLVILRVTGHL